jgi:hypothetical protein
MTAERLIDLFLTTLTDEDRQSVLQALHKVFDLHSAEGYPEASAIEALIDRLHVSPTDDGTNSYDRANEAIRNKETLDCMSDEDLEAYYADHTPEDIQERDLEETPRLDRAEHDERIRDLEMWGK